MNIYEVMLVSFVTTLANRPLDYDEIERLNHKIPKVVSEAIVCDLLQAMQCGRKIDAIKAYRAMTGSSLLEAKNAVERYWVAQPAALTVVPNNAMMHDR